MPRKSSFDKFKEMMEFAERQTDPQLKNLAIKAANTYLKKEAPHTKSDFLLILSIFVILVISVSIIVWRLGPWLGLLIFIIVFGTFPFIAGLYLRICNRISQSNLIVLYKEGSKLLKSLLKRNGKTRQ